MSLLRCGACALHTRETSSYVSENRKWIVVAAEYSTRYARTPVETLRILAPPNKNEGKQKPNIPYINRIRTNAKSVI